jgi:chromate transporter
VITSSFIGYLVAGFAGAVTAAVGTFLPCYLCTVIPAPYFRRYGKRPALAAIVQGITAAATGAIAGAVVVLGKGAIVDFPTAAIALATLALTAKWRTLPEPVVVVAAAAAGLLLLHAG